MMRPRPSRTAAACLLAAWLLALPGARTHAAEAPLAAVACAAKPVAPRALACPTPDAGQVATPGTGRAVTTGAANDAQDAMGTPDAAGDDDAEPDTATSRTAAQDEVDDRVLDRAQPDFTLVNLPTTLRLPKFASAFRVTHRFNRPLGDGSFGSLLEDFFGLDAGAQIGLEFRFGLWSGWQAGIYRTSDRTIQFFTQYSAVRQGAGSPVGIDAFLTAEGTNNFKDSYSPGVGAVVSRTFGTRAALYATPLWVDNANPLPSEVVDDNSTLLLGLGGRVRVLPTVYVVGEFAPRVAGYDPGDHLLAFAIEKRVGGHAFQLNFSNSTGSTMAQVARSFADNDNWYIGFNISRKFY
jgi:hypothetical protein